MVGKIRISVRQLAVLVFLCVIGDMILIYPSIIASIAKQDGWISSIIGIPCGLAVIWLLLVLYEKYPNLSLFEASRRIVGTLLGSLVSIWYLFYFLVNASIHIREVSDFMTSQIYIQTPLRIFALLYLLILICGMYTGVESLARASEILLPGYLFLLIFLIACLLPQCDLTRIQPFFETGIVQIVHGAVVTVAYPLGEIVVILMILPYVKREPHLKRDVMLAALAAVVILTLILVVSLLVLGPFLSHYSIYTSYVLTQKINIGDFIQRVEGIMAVTWIVATFFKTSLYYYAFTQGVAQVFRLRDMRPFILPTGMLMFGLSIMVAPDIIYYFDTIVPFWVDWDLTSAIIIPLALLGIYTVRQKWTKRKSIPHRTK